MRRWRTRTGYSAGISLLVALSVGPTFAAESAPLEGEALAAAEAAARQGLASLADGTPAVDSKQAFDVKEGGAHVRVVPVRYTPRDPGPLTNVDHCAIAILEQDWPVATVRTIGVGYSETVGCTGLDGIAFPDLDGDGRFDIALIYSTFAPPDRERKTPVVLRRAKGGTFAVDDGLGTALDEQGGITTLKALRRAAEAKLKALRR